jgi:hypothetical protein
VYVKVHVFKHVSLGVNHPAMITVSGHVPRIVGVGASKVVRMDAKDVHLVQETARGIKWREHPVQVEHVQRHVNMIAIRTVLGWHVVPSVEQRLLEHVKQIAA